MTLTNDDYRCLIGFLSQSKTAQEAKTWLEIWFKDKSAAVYKEGWLDACEYNDCEYDGYLDDDDCEGVGCTGYGPDSYD